MPMPPLYDGLDEVERLIASLDKQMNLHNTSPIFGVGQAPDLGFKGAVLHAIVSPNGFLLLPDYEIYQSYS